MSQNRIGIINLVTDLVTDFVTVFVISVVKYKDMEIRPVWWFPAVILGLIVAVGSTEAARYEKKFYSFYFFNMGFRIPFNFST